MTQPMNDPEPVEALTPPLVPGEARVWLELGAGADPVATLRAALADWETRAGGGAEADPSAGDVQGFNFQYRSAGKDGQTIVTTFDGWGHIVSRMPAPITPYLIRVAGKDGEVLTRTVYY